MLKKTLKQKKFFEDLVHSYQKLLKDLSNIKDLFDLAIKKKTKKQSKTVLKKISNIFQEIKEKRQIAFCPEKMTIMISI